MKKVPITELTQDYKIEVEESDGVLAYYLVANDKRYLMEANSDDEAVEEVKTIDKRLRES